MRVRVLEKNGANARAWPRTDGERPGTATVVTLAEALTREWSFDAYVVGYEATDDAPGRLRLNLGAIAAGASVRMVTSLLDVDDPVAHADDAPARDDWREGERAKFSRLLAEHPGLLVYETRGGYRLAGLLEVPRILASAADVERWRVLVGRRLAWLSRRFSIVGDPACHDWTRFFRLPRVLRDGEVQRRPMYGDPHAVGAWPDLRDEDHAADLAELERLAVDHKGWNTTRDRVRPPATLPAARRAAPGAPRSRAIAAPPLRVGEHVTVAQRLADALDAQPRTGLWHGLFQSIVGALLDLGWTAAQVRGVAAELGRIYAGRRPDAGRELDALAQDTPNRRDAGGMYRGRTSLRADAPDVADVLDELTAPDLGEPPPDEVPLDVYEAPAGALLEALDDVTQLRAAGSPYPAAATLREHHPDVLCVLPDEARTLRWAGVLRRAPAPAEVNADEAGAMIAAALDEASKGRDVTVLRATPGAGKSYDSARTAARRWTQRELRTVIAAPSHAVAEQLLAHVRTHGAEPVYLAGVLAYHDADGRLECRHPDAVRRIAEGGASSRDVLCDGNHYGRRVHPDDAQQRLRLPVVAEQRDRPCEHRETCRAYRETGAALDALDAAGVVVTVHQMAAVAAAWAAKHDALVIVDEAPPLVDSARVTADALLEAAATIAGRRVLSRRETAWRAPMLRALAEGVRRAAGDVTVCSVEQLLDLAVGVEQRTAWVAACAFQVDADGEATAKERRSIIPRPAAWLAAQAKRDVSRCADALAAWRLAGIIARAAVREGRCELDLVEGVRVLAVAAVGPVVTDLLAQYQGPRVILDATANADAVRAALAAAPGAAPATVREVRVDVRDGAPVERVFVPWAHGTRTNTLGDAGAVWWREVLGPLREGLALAVHGLPRGSRVALLTYKPIADALRSREGLPKRVAAMLAELLDANGHTLACGHYHATRGRDDWRDADALVALGSPWPDLATMAQEAAVLGLAAADLARHVTRAELAQVCGRLRAPRRTAPGRVVVVATVPPLDADARWTVRELVRGATTQTDGTSLADRADAIGVKAAAREAGCSPRTVRRARQLRDAGALFADTVQLEGGGAHSVTDTEGGTPVVPQSAPPSPTPSTGTSATATAGTVGASATATAGTVGTSATATAGTVGASATATAGTVGTSRPAPHPEVRPMTGARVRQSLHSRSQPPPDTLAELLDDGPGWWLAVTRGHPEAPPDDPDDVALDNRNTVAYG